MPSIIWHLNENLTNLSRRLSIGPKSYSLQDESKIRGRLFFELTSSNVKMIFERIESCNMVNSLFAMPAGCLLDQGAIFKSRSSAVH